MNESQQQHGENSLKDYCRHFNINDEYLMASLLHEVNYLREFYEWVNADEFLNNKVHKTKPSTCKFSKLSFNFFASDCGKMFRFEDRDGNFKYCPFCRKEISCGIINV